MVWPGPPPVPQHAAMPGWGAGSAALEALAPAPPRQAAQLAPGPCLVVRHQAAAASSCGTSSYGTSSEEKRQRRPRPSVGRALSSCVTSSCATSGAKWGAGARPGQPPPVDADSSRPRPCHELPSLPFSPQSLRSDLESACRSGACAPGGASRFRTSAAPAPPKSTPW